MGKMRRDEGLDGSIFKILFILIPQVWVRRVLNLCFMV